MKRLFGWAVGLALCGCGSPSSSGPGGPLSGGVVLPPTQNSFVDPSATLNGRVEMGESVYVAPFARVEAGQSLVRIGSQSDLQDNVTVLADKDREVQLGERVILAHGCTVLGPAQLGAAGLLPCFVGFNAEVAGAVVEPGAMVGIRARLGPGVILRRGKRILPGRSVTTQAQADDPALGKVVEVTEQDRQFMQGVLTVNLDLASGYARMQSQDPEAVRGIGPDPSTPLHPEQIQPSMNQQPAAEPNFRNRVIGHIFITDPLDLFFALTGQRDSIRADEGGPFRIGAGTGMADEVTVHALEHSQISVGRNCQFGFHSVIHGGEDLNQVPHDTSTLGNNVVVGPRAVVFRSALGDNCTIGQDALVDGCNLPAGSNVPPRTLLIGNQVVGSLEW